MGKASKGSLADRVIARLKATKATRVDRDALVRFMCATRGEGFLRLPVATALSPEAKVRTPVAGWVVPATCLGRTGRGADVSVRNSLTAWTRDRLLPAIVAEGGPAIPLSSIAFHLEDRDGQAVVVIYRKA